MEVDFIWKLIQNCSYVLKTFAGSKHLLIFILNHANFGGAIYVADDANSGACLPDNECFIQTLSLTVKK